MYGLADRAMPVADRMVVLCDMTMGVFHCVMAVVECKQLAGVRYM